MSHTITIIGAGSAVFSLGMVRDVCLTPSLQGSTVRFMDIDQTRLDAIHTLCARDADEMGVALTLEKTTDRRVALAGADVVVNAALVAGHQRLREGWAVAQRHGYRWGGSLHVAAFTQRSYDLLLELVMLDPWTRTPEQAKTMLDGVLALEFNAEMREHYQ